MPGEEGGGAEGGGKSEGSKSRKPQSAQSVPKAQSLYSEPWPPSSQYASFRKLHVFVHEPGGDCGGEGGAGGEGGDGGTGGAHDTVKFCGLAQLVPSKAYHMATLVGQVAWSFAPMPPALA